MTTSPQSIFVIERRRAFERYWWKDRVAQLTKRQRKKSIWFERSDLWGKDGYAQPIVHYDWQLWNAAIAWGRSHDLPRR